MKKLLALLSVFLMPMLTFASEANLVIPSDIKNQNILYWGFLIIFLGMMFGLYQFVQVKKLKAHKSMLDVAQVIYETCKTYLKQQGRFLMILFIFIGATVGFYFG
jgi:K(+)-stimulated pyrophosphate-energized sodium pump